MVDVSKLSPAARRAYESLSSEWGRPINLTSGYRDPAHNAKVGGAKGSQHIHGNALDISVAGMPHEERIALADAARRAGFQGFGFYDNSLHFDVGPARAWGPDYSRGSVPEWAQAFVGSQPSGNALASHDVPTPQEPTTNALAPREQPDRRPEFRMVDMRLDPRAFMTSRRNALAPLPFEYRRNA